MKEAWDILTTVLGGVARNFKDMMILFLPTVIILSIILIAAVWFFMSQTGLISFLLIAFVYCFVVIAFSGLAIKFHRYYLRGERELSLRPFEINWRKGLGYFGYALLIGIIIGLVGIAFSLLLQFFEPSNMVAMVLFLILYMLSIWVQLWLQFRLSMILPSYAVEAERSFGDCWSDTASHSKMFWALSLLIVLGVGALFVIGFVIGAFFPALFHNGFVLFVLGILGAFAYFYIICVSLGLMTESYRRIFEM